MDSLLLVWTHLLTSDEATLRHPGRVSLPAKLDQKRPFFDRDARRRVLLRLLTDLAHALRDVFQAGVVLLLTHLHVMGLVGLLGGLRGVPTERGSLDESLGRREVPCVKLTSRRVQGLGLR